MYSMYNDMELTSGNVASPILLFKDPRALAEMLNQSANEEYVKNIFGAIDGFTFRIMQKSVLQETYRKRSRLHVENFKSAPET